MRIAISNPDHIGDFVLRQPMIAAFLAEGHAVLLIVRDFVAPLAQDMFPAVHVLQCTGNPYGRDFSLNAPLGQELLREVKTFAPDLFVVASFQHTQLEELVAAEIPGVDCVGFTGYLFQARPEAPGTSTIRFVTRVAAGKDSSELDKNKLLCAAVLGHSVKLDPPRIEARPEAIIEAAAHLDQLGLNALRFWAVCAGDAPDKRVRNWRPEQWAELCRELVGKQGATLLFVGSPDEHAATMEIQNAMGEAGLQTTAMTGAPVKLDVLVAILQLASGYIGKDTGPMHIAAALGKPVLALFGGGTWPRFIPAAESGAAFTLSVPCTGCDWICYLSRSHCVKDIPVAPVLRKAEAMLRGELSGFSVEVLQPERVSGAAIARDLLASVELEHKKVAVERANFLQWHDDRLREISELRTQLKMLASSMQLRVDTAESRFQGILSDHELRLKRKSLELASALELIPDLREELAARYERLAERDSLIAELEPRVEQAERELQHTRKLLVEANQDMRVISEDHAARLVVIETLAKELEESNHDRSAKQKAVDSLQQQLEVCEADRERRLQVIEELSIRLAETERDRAERLALIESISNRLEETERDRAERLTLIESISNRLEETERDRAERLTLIESISSRLEESEQDRHQRLRLIESLSTRLAESEQDREERLQVLKRISTELEISESDRAARGDQIAQLHKHAAHLAWELSELRNLLPLRILRHLHLL